MALDCDDETLPNISRFLWAKTTTPLSPPLPLPPHPKW